MSSKAILLIILLGMAIPALAVAQHDPPKSDTGRFGTTDDTTRIFQDYIFGFIRSINKTEMVLDKTTLGDEQVFQLSSKTKFVQDRKPSTLGNLKVGDQVWVEMKKDKAGNRQARKVYSGISPTKEP